MVSLQEELSCIQSYLYIQKVRYADILNYEIQAEPEALDCRIQKLSLQPLVENALYHGIEKKRGGGTIRVCADVKDGCLVVQVATGGGRRSRPDFRGRVWAAQYSKAHSAGLWSGLRHSREFSAGLRDSGHTADSGKIVKKLRSSRKKQKSGFPAGLFSVKFK